MPRVRELEFLVGAGFLLGPLIYAMTLPSYGFEHCEKPSASAEPPVVVERVVPWVPPGHAEPSFVPRPFMFVAGDAVILHVDAPADWGRGDLFEPPGEARYRAARSVDVGRLPGDLQARVGRSIDLYDASGKLCTTKIERLELVAQYDGWGLSEVFESDLEYDDDGWPTDISREKVREQLWKTQPRWLIAELSSDSDCDGATWARDVDLPAPAILTESERSNPTTRARLRAFRRSPELAELKAQYAEYLEDEAAEGETTWEAEAAEYPARASAWVDAEGETQVVELRFGHDADLGCGGFDLRLEKLEIRREDEFEAMTHGVDPIAVFDADLDGRFELLYDTSDDGWGRQLDSETEALWLEASVEADWACPC